MKTKADQETKRSYFIKAEVTSFKNEKRVKLIMRYDTVTTNAVKNIPGARWSKDMHCWHIPYTSDYLSVIKSCINNNNLCIQSIEKPINNPITDLQKEFIDVKIHKDKGLIYVKMPYIYDLITQIRKMDGAWWHPGAKIWSVHFTSENLENIKVLFDKKEYLLLIKEINNNDHVKRIQKSAVLRNNIPKDFLVQLKLENKSKRTIEVYTGFISQFLNDFKDKNIEQLTDEEIRDYILEHREKRGYSESYQNQLVSSIRSYYKNQFNRVFESNILPRPRRSLYLPKVIPREYIQKMIELCRNEKHKMILLMLYGFGLRISELINLQLNDFDFERQHLAIIKAKGKKDRILPIPAVIIPQIKRYLKSYLPERYYIEGQNGEQYSATSIQSVVRKTAKKAGIKQRVTPHMIRHCYATHMLERGIDLRYIQNLLGHKSSKTTEIYTHVSMRKLIDLNNPLDDIQL